MKNYIIMRLLATVPLLLGISFLCFVFINLIPSDPAEVALRIRQTPIITEELIAQTRAELGLDHDARRDNSPPGGVITPSKSLLHICQQNYKNEGRGNFPPPCFYVLRRCLVNAGSQVAACSSCGLASGFSPLVSRATA